MRVAEAVLRDGDHGGGPARRRGGAGQPGPRLGDQVVPVLLAAQEDVVARAAQGGRAPPLREGRAQVRVPVRVAHLERGREDDQGDDAGGGQDSRGHGQHVPARCDADALPRLPRLPRRARGRLGPPGGRGRHGGQRGGDGDHGDRRDWYRGPASPLRQAGHQGLRARRRRRAHVHRGRPRDGHRDLQAVRHPPPHRPHGRRKPQAELRDDGRRVRRARAHGGPERAEGEAALLGFEDGARRGGGRAPVQGRQGGEQDPQPARVRRDLAPPPRPLAVPARGQAGARQRASHLERLPRLGTD